MKRMLRRIRYTAKLTWKNCGDYRQFRKEFRQFQALSAGNGCLPVFWEDRYPIMNERTQTTPIDSQYVYHTAWATRLLARTRPQRHVDISSYVYFPTIVSAFIPIDFYDYRPLPVRLSGLTTGAEDLTALTFANNSIPSLSCMHVIEHVGLGRYGDRLDPEGDLKAARELKRVLAPGGTLLIVVPVGTPRVCFNAHRIYAYSQVLAMFEGLTLDEFAVLLDDPSQGLISNASAALVARQYLGCGCFAFKKPQ